VIRRRHVIYVEGYDPQGAEGYYNLFQRSWGRFLKLWRFNGTLGPLRIDSEDFAHWDVAAEGPNWRTETHYEFLRQEQMIRANMAEPLAKLIFRALRWSLCFMVDGSNYRIMLASWRFGMALMHFQMLMVLCVGLAGVAGGLAGWAAVRFGGWHGAVAAAAGIAAALALLVLLRPLARRWFVIQINSHWPYLVEFVRGEKSCFEHPVEVCAHRLVEAAKANAADEIVIVGHSGGGALLPVIVARALALDPDLGRRGPRVVMLTPGSIMPAAGVHPWATVLREALERVAVEPSIVWIDPQARKDVLNFWGLDPIAGLGIDVGERRCNPLVWSVRFRDMISAERYDRVRVNLFVMHYQFIMANDKRAPYDYCMLVAGPVAVEEWARRGDGIVSAFSEDGAFAGVPAASS
jgi:hypothetical protein